MFTLARSRSVILDFGSNRNYPNTYWQRSRRYATSLSVESRLCSPRTRIRCTWHGVNQICSNNLYEDASCLNNLTLNGFVAHHDLRYLRAGKGLTSVVENPCAPAWRILTGSYVITYSDKVGMLDIMLMLTSLISLRSGI